ncbi:hypothetical protein [Aliikangiella coralliicola]|uniref:DUF2306 domain-containing protein n=1 Tax=Aliikangiella coralliicola TaxID=2592383 RepID=A0A545U4D7_9GAMM|nr:hypothetical protein [Aliikangiella coralliicola]TQV84339.1 hypothetical protein FLL46_22195 [Aliikangiella coralliicola]
MTIFSSIISSLVAIHIGAGAIGLISGSLALMFRKGSNQHKKSGKIFLVAMLVMALTGVFIAYSRSIMLSFANGLLVIYLVSTGWMAVKRKAGEIGNFEKGALALALCIFTMLLTFGFQAIETGSKDGFPPQVFFFFASVAAISAVLDIKMIYHGGVAGTIRITRHLWRMCFPLFMATAAFFLGQAKIFPDPLRKIEFLAAPVIVIVLLMMFWLVRVRLLNRYTRI